MKLAAKLLRHPREGGGPSLGGTAGRWMPACAGMTLVFLLLALSLNPARAAVDESDNADKSASGLPIPRFASLRSDEVNMRAGPGTRYPIAWVFTRQGLPVEIIGEFEVWRHVRDPDGAEGWMHKSALTGKRAAITTGGPHDLHDSDNLQSAVVAHLESGAVGQLLSCAKDWCRLKFDDVKGYLPKTEFWGAYSNETFD